MHDKETKLAKAISETIMEAQSIDMEINRLLNDQWKVLRKAQELLAGVGEQMKLFRDRGKP